MRKLLRNTEIMSSFVIYVILSLVVLAGEYFYDRKLMLPTFFLCIAFTALHLNVINIRYKRISKLSADIDKILHGDENIQFEN